MTTAITIHLSDADYEAVRAAAARADQSPEDLITATIAECFGTGAAQPAQTAQQQAIASLLTMMRERGHLVDPKDYPPYPGVADLPPRGSPERVQFEEELAQELGEAFEQSGLSILDLIERR